MLTASSRLVDLKAKLFRGLADPSRLAILEALRGDAHCVGDLVVETGLGQSNVSNHLACLLECGLVQREQRGRHAYYQVADPRIPELLVIVEALLADAAQGFYDCTRYEARARDVANTRGDVADSGGEDADGH